MIPADVINAFAFASVADSSDLPKLRALVVEADTIALSRIMTPTAPPLRAVESNAPPALLDVEAAAKFLGVSTSWVYHRAATLPHKRVGGRLRFVASELERHMKGGRS